MAKPIRATPELKNSEAKEFVKKMVLKEKEKIMKQDADLAKAIKTITPLVC